MTSLVSPIIAAFALSVGLGACVFGGPEDDPKPCAAIAQAPERNPDTGQCETRGGFCQDGALGEAGQPQTPGKGPVEYLSPVPSLESWAACYGTCEGLDEASCRANDSCQVGILDGEVWGCWELNPYGLPEGACDSLEARGCARRNDCSPVYASIDPQDDGSGTEFVRCEEEFDVVHPPLLTCAMVLCEVGTQCVETAEGPTCVPNETDPGTCYGEALCNLPAPACPEGTLPGVTNGCYSGYCIPLSACEPAPLCESITNEAVCIGRADCAPYYTQCDGPGCELQFAFCGDL